MSEIEEMMGELGNLEASFSPAPEGAAPVDPTADLTAPEPAAPAAETPAAEPPAITTETASMTESELEAQLLKATDESRWADVQKYSNALVDIRSKKIVPSATSAPLPEETATVPTPVAPAEPELTQVPDRLRAAAESAPPVVAGDSEPELPARAEAVLPAPDAPAAAEAPEAPAAPTAEAAAAPAEAAPAPAIGFSGRVELARDAVNRAVAGYNGLRDRIVKEQQDSSGYKGYGADLIEAEEGRTGITEPEATDEEFKAMESAAEAAKAAFGLKELPKELKDRLATQRQLKLGRSMARDAQTNWDAQLKKDLGAVTPQLWEKTSRLQREVDGIRTFFLRLGNNGSLQKEVADIEQARAGVFWNILDKKQKQGVEAELKQKQDALAAFENPDGLLARGDMPAELRQVIEAARNGQPYNFGEGMVGGFRREAYAGILNALGLTLPEAAAAPAAAAPAPVIEIGETTPIVAAEDQAGSATEAAPDEDEREELENDLNLKIAGIEAGIDQGDLLSAKALTKNVAGVVKLVRSQANLGEAIESMVGSAKKAGRKFEVAIARVLQRSVQSIASEGGTEEEKQRALKRVGEISHGLSAGGVALEGVMGMIENLAGIVVNEIVAQTGAK